jgi:hypothetical protein
MSGTFTIQIEVPLFYDFVLVRLPDGLFCAGMDNLPSGPWQRDTLQYFYYPSKTIRGVEVLLEGAEFTVRLMACSSLPDMRLGIGLARAVARLIGERVIAPDGEVLSESEFAGAYGEQWIRSQQLSHSSFALEKALVRPLCLPTPFGQVNVTPDKAFELMSGIPDPRVRADALQAFLISDVDRLRRRS